MDYCALTETETNCTDSLFQVIELGMFVKTFKVEVYFIELMLAQNSDIKATQKAKFSKNDVLSEHLVKLFMALPSPTS